MLKDFSENPFSLLLAVFLQTQCEFFFSTIKSIEIANLPIIEIKSHVVTLAYKINS